MKNRRSDKNIHLCLSPSMCDLSIPVRPFENKMKSVSSNAASQRWSCEFRVHVAEKDIVNWRNPFIGAAESCASWSTLVRWPNAGDDLAFQANRLWNFMTLSFSFECKMNFRKFFVGSPGNEDSITKTAKVPQSVQAVFLFFFFFFFLPFSLFFFSFLFAKKLTHKQVRPRNVVVLISQSFICTVSWHWPRRARSAFFHNNVTWQYTLHIVT